MSYWRWPSGAPEADGSVIIRTGFCCGAILAQGLLQKTANSLSDRAKVVAQVNPPTSPVTSPAEEMEFVDEALRVQDFGIANSAS